jgi:hypothetical protein
MSKSVRNSNARNSCIPMLANDISECITKGDRLTSKLIKKWSCTRFIYIHNRSTLKIEVDEQCR